MNSIRNDVEFTPPHTRLHGNFVINHVIVPIAPGIRNPGTLLDSGRNFRDSMEHVCANRSINVPVTSCLLFLSTPRFVSLSLVSRQAPLPSSFEV